MTAEQEQSRSHMSDRTSRRSFGAATLAVFGGAFLTRRLEAFPAGSESVFLAATRLLRRFGVSVGGAFDEALGRDILTINTVPQGDIQYDFIVSELDAASGIQPCVKTAFFAGLSEFTHFEENPAGGIQPCTKTTVGGPAITFEHFTVNDAGGIVPCTVSTIAGASERFELFDPNAESGIVPCVKVAAERLADGSLGLVDVEINEPNLNFIVRIGVRSYRLIAGQLVEDVR